MKRGFLGRLAAWILMGTLLFGGVIAATPAPVVQAAEISETSVVLRKGTSITLSVSGKYKSIRWGSSNTKVATVTQKGRVKAIAPGTAKITGYRWNDLVNAGTYGTESWFGLKNFGFICEWE